MYLILALLFCALLVVALGIVLFVALTGEPREQAAPAQAPVAAPQSGRGTSLSVPGVTPPSVTSPSLRPPSVSAPSVTAPSLSSSGISAGSVTAPSVTAPSVSSPSLYGPSVSTSRVPTLPGVSGGQIPATAAAPQTSGQPAAAETGGTPYLALIIILSVLLVVAVGAAVYFALRRA